eukprot:TRINITY_DN14945_c0_g1_i1.p1 TRINITY_DN14945_c0_g1~~TRINITY_DN14945_c0_g1_i1.p1  ORF type:complete len:804 (-),score=232.86 TRINITY_DN14945_c0_g1_i1:219-2630(-)
MNSTSNMAGLDVVRRMKLSEPDHYHGMVKMHLSFLLDLHTDECDCSFLWEKPEKDSVDSKLKKAFSTPMALSLKKSKVKGVMDGVPLTQEGVCQVYQIIEYLGRPHNITQEGLFRKHGNLKKQQALKERLNKGVPLNLDEEEFSVHECAAVLKNFLAMLPEPLLTDAYYRAHCQVPLIRKNEMSDQDVIMAEEKQIACVQLLFQLIPEVNLALLRDLFPFLSHVAKKEAENKMNATNLGTLFSTHILCPRKLSPEVLQSNHQLLSKAVTFMIKHADKLFELPDKLTMDIRTYISRKDNMITPKCKKGRGPDSPVVSTIFSFVDRAASLRATHGNETDHALAQLYAHVQGMPESAHKRRLVSKLNEANGKGTPDVATSGSVRTTGKGTRQRRRSGDGIINLLTPRRKRPATGSYSVQGANDTRARREIQPSHSFKRQNSLHVPATPQPSRTLSPSSHSSPAVLSPCRERLPSPHTLSGETPSSQASDVCPIDEVDTPGKDSSLSSLEEGRSDGEDLSGSYCEGAPAPPLPPRTPAPAVRSKEFLSPGSPASKMSPMTQAITTPRSRGGVMVCSNTQLDRWNMLLDQQSPCQPCSYNEDEPGGETGCDTSISSLVSNGVHSACSREREKDGAYRHRSLSTEFKAFLAEHGMEAPEDSESEVSMLDSSYSDEVRRLLRSDQPLSTSLQAVLDGEEPVFDVSNSSVLNERSMNSVLSPGSCNSSVVTVKSVSGSVSTLMEGDSNTTVQMFLKEDSENLDPIGPLVSTKSVPRRGMKRRSITEGGPQTAAAVVTAVQNSNSIIFETDL